MNRHLSWH